MLRKSKIYIEWSPQFAYAIGLIVSDGNLSKDCRHMSFTSKDLSLVLTFKQCLNLSNRIGRKARGANLKNKKYYVIQWGDRNFYIFLNSIGVYATKSKTIGCVSIPDIYFKDFFRGCIDGDGTLSSFKHKESSLLQLKLRLVSASKEFLIYIQKTISRLVGIRGGWITQGKNVYELCWGKSDAVKIFDFMYDDKQSFYLKRKYALSQTWAGGEMADALRLGRSAVRHGGSSPPPPTLEA